MMNNIPQQISDIFQYQQDISIDIPSQTEWGVNVPIIITVNPIRSNASVSVNFENNTNFDDLESIELEETEFGQSEIGSGYNKEIIESIEGNNWTTNYNLLKEDINIAIDDYNINKFLTNEDGQIFLSITPTIVNDIVIEATVDAEVISDISIDEEINDNTASFGSEDRNILYPSCSNSCVLEVTKRYINIEIDEINNISISCYVSDSNNQVISGIPIKLIYYSDDKKDDKKEILTTTDEEGYALFGYGATLNGLYHIDFVINNNELYYDLEENLTYVL